MKKFFISLMLSLLVSITGGVGIAMAAALPSVPVIGALFGASLLPKPSQLCAFQATVYKEVWTGEVVKKMSQLATATFLDGIRDYSRYVSNVGDEAQAIHLVYMGVEPDVLINNSTYPIALQSLAEEDITISLDKYQTKQTPVTDDELYALSYDKISTVKDLHGEAIMKAKFQKAIHALAPSSATTDLPVLTTTGTADATGRKKLTWDDVLALKAKLDALQVDPVGRRLVLCPDHVNDLLSISEAFQNQFYNAQTGTINPRYGFENYSYAGNPYYTVATKAKLGFGAVPGTGTSQASVFFSMSRAAKAEGWTKMYWAKAENDPDYQRNRINFRHNYIVLPTREEGRGAIISALS